MPRLPPPTSRDSQSSCPEALSDTRITRDSSLSCHLSSAVSAAPAGLPDLCQAEKRWKKFRFHSARCVKDSRRDPPLGAGCLK